MRDEESQADGARAADVLLLSDFAARRRDSGAGDGAGDGAGINGRAPLIDESERAEFVGAACDKLSAMQQAEVLRHAVGFATPWGDAPPEVSFIALYAALESVLTHSRLEGHFHVLSAEEFGRLERELRAWLRRHPLLEGDAARRGLIYEKVRELNRLPFGRVFDGFCQSFRVDLSDLWPVMGRPDEWPLTEIRHRLVHGDPFASRPASALACAGAHLRWTVERMILAALGWPVSRSAVAPARLSADGGPAYHGWQTERAKFA